MIEKITGIPPIDQLRASIADDTGVMPTNAEIRFGIRNGALDKYEIAPAVARVAVIRAVNEGAEPGTPKLDENIAYQVPPKLATD